MATQFQTGTAGANDMTGTAGADLIYAFNPAEVSPTTSSISAQRVVSNLNTPVYATAAPGDLGRLFVVEKGGVIKALDLNTHQTAPFLNLSTEVSTDGEMGLLGMAFHPDFVANHKFYVFLSNTDGDTEIREYKVAAGNPTAVDLSSERLVLKVDLPDTTMNHRSGWLGFGPDGKLYIPLGDGGGSPGNRPQDPNTLLGKVLRIDVDGDDFPSDPNKNYSIPDDNPFVGQAGEDEIWALGMRNPFRDSFDRGLGGFFIADVGQDEWEEIDLGLAGANYGWPLFEGPEARSSTPPNGFTFPIYSYDHSVGRTIIGGYVYRGQSEGLQGQYFFADFITNRVFTLAQSANGGDWIATERTAQIQEDVGSLNMPVSFAEDARGDLYVVDMDGEIFLLTPTGTSSDVGDVVHAAAGNDQVYGGSGNDELFGQKGADTLYGMNGDDTLHGNNGFDLLIGGAGNDTAFGDNGNDTVDGGAGNDTLNGGEGNDVMSGGAGNDTLNGNQGTDVLTGGAGNDGLNGNLGNDTIDGGTGSDTLAGGMDADRLTGGSGEADWFVFTAVEHSTSAHRDIITDFEHALDHIDLTGIDANASAAGNQAFLSATSNTNVIANSVTWSENGGDTIVRADVNGDTTADFVLVLSGTGLNLAQSDFML